MLLPYCSTIMVHFVWFYLVISKTAASIWIWHGNSSKTVLIMTCSSSCLSLLTRWSLISAKLHGLLLHSKSQLMLSMTTLIRFSLSPSFFSRIRWVNASADYVCVFSSAPSTRRAGSPNQASSSAVLPALPLPPHGVRGGENYTRP